MKKLGAVLICLALVLSVVGCGGSKKDIKGTYVVTQIESEGVNIKEGDATWNTMFASTKPEEFCFIEIKDDKNAKLTVMGETTEATYKLDGSKLTMTVDGDDEDLTYEDKTITLDSDGNKMVFKLK